ncbi:MAG TPA: hypothetical protein EYN51_05765 [Flavobacteriales bacterium]|nr:hypothetical protein [Flavobacteriales bacterium]HIA36300.1 hypothetical protein [Flavobacteriales bacterium]
MRKEITFIVDRDSKEYTGLAYSYIRAYEKLGYKCDLVAFNVDKYLYRVLNLIPVLRDQYMASQQRELLRKIKKTRSKVVYVIKGYFLMPRTIDEIKEQGKHVMCFYPDDPFSTSFGSSNAYVRSSINHFSTYLIWHKELIKSIKDTGCENVFYIPFAVDPDIITPPANFPDNAPEDDYYDVSFIGNSDRERIDVIKRISEQLNGWKGKKVVFGNGWKGIEGFDCMPSIGGVNYLQTMHRSKVNLNILRDQNKNSHNMRTFEIPGAGGFMLHEYSEEAAGFFKEGKEAEFFRDVEECSDKIRFYLKNDELRSKIARAGYEKIFSSGYTYSELVKDIEEKISLQPNSTPSKI